MTCSGAMISNTLLRAGGLDRGTKHRNVLVAEEDGPEFAEESALQGFRKEVGKHFRGRAVRDGDVIPFRVIGDKEVSYVDVAGPLASRGFAVELCLGGLFRHGVAKHKAAFEAVCVTLQYAMDLGEPIFDGVHHDGKRQQQPNRNKRLREAAQMP